MKQIPIGYLKECFDLELRWIPVAEGLRGGLCVMETAEGNYRQMSDLRDWRLLDRPARGAPCPVDGKTCEIPEHCGKHGRCAPGVALGVLTGYKLVPIEPTKEMLDALTTFGGRPSWRAEMKKRYALLLAAASPPAGVPGTDGGKKE